MLDLLGEPALIALIGAAGAGKSTAARAFPPAWRLELDALRGMVADDPGDQTATPAAVTLCGIILEARLKRRLSTVVDATNTGIAHRGALLHHARTWRMPAVAITVRTPLQKCVARQGRRTSSRRVPAQIIAEQHASVPDPEQLLTEGWDYVHDASELDLLGLALRRAAAAGPAFTDSFEATFGKDLAAVFTACGAERGQLVIAGRAIELRYVLADPYDHAWQARLAGHCECGGDLWMPVAGPADLLDVYSGAPLDEPVCARCSEPA